MFRRLEEVAPDEPIVNTNLSLYYMKIGDKQTAEDEGGKATLPINRTLGSSGVITVKIATSILSALSQRPPLMNRIEALVRVDDRRWDLRLKDGTLIQLPAIDEEAALIRLDGLEQSQRILDLGLARIDLRNSEFLAVRPRDAVQSAGGV